MPLSRAFGRPYMTTREGVQFTMADRSKLIRCVVQSAALCKTCSTRDRNGRLRVVFLAHQEEIERIAGRKYDAARALYMPFEITPSDIVKYRTRSQPRTSWRTVDTPVAVRSTGRRIPVGCVEGVMLV